MIKLYNLVMKILAIDPGFERVGIAVLKKETGEEELLYSNCFKTSPSLFLHERISLIGEELRHLIKKYTPEALAIESLFFSKNQKTAMGVAQARGVVIYECSRAGLEIFEYTPLQIKVAITSYGKATKNQVFFMVKKLIKIDDSITSDDEIDAIAIGLTAFAHQKPIAK